MTTNALPLPTDQRRPERLDRAAGDVRLRRMFDANFEFIGRSLKSLGVPEGDVDDALQQVFLVASKKLDVIEPGAERSFLFSTAMNVATRAQRTRRRRREVLGDEALDEHDPAPSPEELADRRRARALLDDVLADMTMDLRAVFTLFEIEELTAPEIARLLDIPVGTVASRLRRAREQFQTRVKRLQARMARSGGER